MAKTLLDVGKLLPCQPQCDVLLAFLFWIPDLPGNLGLMRLRVRMLESWKFGMVLRGWRGHRLGLRVGQ